MGKCLSKPKYDREQADPPQVSELSQVYELAVVKIPSAGLDIPPRLLCSSTEPGPGGPTSVLIDRNTLMAPGNLFIDKDKPLPSLPTTLSRLSRIGGFETYEVQVVKLGDGHP